jgi:hypothetical protein
VVDDVLACRRHGSEAFAVAHKQLHTKLLLQHPELFAYPWLRRVKPVRGGSDVYAVVRNRNQVSEL